MNADRNLLFGILAFQNNFIDRQALLTAFDRWTTDKSRLLADILVELGALNAEFRQLLDGLVAAHIKQHGNDAEKSLASVSSVGSLRDELRAALNDPDVEASLAHLSVDSAYLHAASTLSWTAGTPTSAGTRFRVLRPHAHGGLGEVFVAEDQELHREVALKEIQDRFADDAVLRSRFLLEAEVTGGLEHPGVVPVYGLGSYADGRPFYAMRFIKGDSLKGAIKAFHQAKAAGLDPTERTAHLRTLLGRFIDVCNAMEYAHSRGVLHRDLKPGNIMLGKYGETLVVDWGLAKVIGRPEAHAQSDEKTLRPTSASGSAATQMGHRLGTLQYMSPEQAMGQWDELGPTSDVYSLGATLYTLLAGQAPISADERMDMPGRVVKGDFPGPRTVDKDVPRALEAICLKAMAPKPAGRYRSPRALADDIERWRNDQPVSVHRDPFSRQLTRWVRNHKGTAGAAVAAVVVLVFAAFVGSLLSQRTNERTENVTRAKGLVETLVNADSRQLPNVIKQLGQYTTLAKPMIETKLAEATDGSNEKLHLSLALVESDEGQVDYLYEQLLSGHVSYVGVIRDQLLSYRQRIQSDLWELAHDKTKAPLRRFRAGLALATYATTAEQWTAADDAFLAEQLLAANPEHQPRIREYLRPLDNRLLGDLERIFTDPKATESHQLGAANALADFAGKDTVRLARLLSAATPGQYEILYPLVAGLRDSAAQELLNQLVRETPAADLPQIKRVALGKRRAGAAITLLRQGEREGILDVLRVADDPESLTQFVHRCRQRGILPRQLLECLKVADELRQRETGESRRIEDRVLYGLLLALGEFEQSDLPESQGDGVVEQLANWYANDPSSAIHGAAGWLLRHWNQDDVVKEVDQTAFAYSPDREWFTLEIRPKPPLHVSAVSGESRPTPEEVDDVATANVPCEEASQRESADGPPQSNEPTPPPFYVTFVVFPPGKYVIGSPPDEVNRQSSEQRHIVTLVRPFALADREITWEQIRWFDRWTSFDRHAAWEERFGRTLSDAEPAFGVTWFEAVSYCRWLTEQAGLGEEEQVYADPNALAANARWDWPVNLEKHGFRLPTEVEWEVACRSGTASAYSFGNDGSLLEHYGRFFDNSVREDSQKWSHPAGRLRPNLGGLLDIHGNLFEWCQDWYDSYGSDAVDPLGAALSVNRVDRGGSWNYHGADCRSAYRESHEPEYRNYNLGLRVLLVPSCQASEPADRAARESLLD